MTKLLFLAIFLISSTAYAVCPIITEGGVQKVKCDTTFAGDVTFDGSASFGGAGVAGAPVTQTTADATVYVRAAGNDANDCLTVGAACLTIQGAIGKVPLVVKHNITVDIEAGSFAGFTLEGYTVNEGVQLIVQGTLGAPTLTCDGGACDEDGTADSGGATSVGDSTQNWLTGELIGYLVFVDTEYRTIRSNSGTIIGVLGAFDNGVTSGKAYTIVEQKTIIDSGGGPTGRIEVTANLFQGNSVEFKDMTISTGDTGVYVYNTTGAPFIRNMYIDNPTADGVTISQTSGQVGMENLYIYSAGDRGFTIEDSPGLSVISYAESRFLYVDLSSSVGALNVLRSGGPFYFYAPFFSVGSYAINIEDVDTAFIYDPWVSTGTTSLYASNTRYIYVYSMSCAISSIANVIIRNVGYIELEDIGMTSGSGYGIMIDDIDGTDRTAGSTVNITGSSTVTSSGDSGIIALNRSTLFLDDITGTADTNYGLEMGPFANVMITSQTLISGPAGDATFDGGTTDITWATDFASDGDVVVNTATLSRVERKD